MGKNSTNWNWYHFDELSTRQLYQIIGLRIEVFALEQNCVYQDLDNIDQQAWHLGYWQDDTLIAYLRLLAAGVKYKEPAIGRVITKASHRGLGLGRELMEVGIVGTEQRFPEAGIRLSAQKHLEDFYSTLGFIAEGDIYLEDQIPHIEMYKAP